MEDSLSQIFITVAIVHTSTCQVVSDQRLVNYLLCMLDIHSLEDKRWKKLMQVSKQIFTFQNLISNDVEPKVDTCSSQPPNCANRSQTSVFMKTEQIMYHYYVSTYLFTAQYIIGNNCTSQTGYASEYINNTQTRHNTSQRYSLRSLLHTEPKCICRCLR